MNAQPLNMGNRFQLRQQPVQLMVFCHQRITAGENDFIEFRMVSDIIERLLPVMSGAFIVLIREVTAETVAAVDRAPAFH